MLTRAPSRCSTPVRLALVLVASAAGIVAALAQSAPAASGQATAQSAARQAGADSTKIVVPADTTIPLELKNALSSRTAYVGQAVYCETTYPVTVGNRIVIPVGSYVKGAITQVVRPGRVKGKAQLGLRFDSLTLPDGTTRSLRATLSGYAGNGKQGFSRDEGKIQGESSKGQDVGTVAQTAGEGAIIGAIAGRSVKGAGIGGGAGSLGGLIWVLATRGKEIVIPERTSLELQGRRPSSSIAARWTRRALPRVRRCRVAILVRAPSFCPGAAGGPENGPTRRPPTASRKPRTVCDSDYSCTG